jgi:site-specific DNA-methyltransferase (adenine-specific)
MSDLFGGKKDDWATPQWLFDALDEEFAFGLDPCCYAHTAKCDLFFTEADDGLAQSWHGRSVYVNPPYSEMNDWMRKCADESRKGAKVIVALVPARTDTKAWQDTVLRTADEIRFIRGRVQFVGAEAGAKFPSALVIWRHRLNLLDRNPSRHSLKVGGFDIRGLKPKGAK